MTAVRLQRTIARPPAVVYRAWLDPATLTRWAAPVEFDAVRAEVDERVGGHYRCWHVDADGTDVGGFEAEILELVPDERIVLRWSFVGPDRAPIGNAESRLEITLRPAGDGCELTLVHDRLDGLERAMPGMSDATLTGWTGTLERLADALSSGSGR